MSSEPIDFGGGAEVDCDEITMGQRERVSGTPMLRCKETCQLAVLHHIHRTLVITVKKKIVY